MDFFLQRKNVLILISGLLIFCVILIVFALSLINPSPSEKITPTPISKTPSVPTISSSPQPTFEYSNGYIKESKKVNQQENSVLQQGALVDKFEKTLPYTGTYITLSYDFDTNAVVVHIDTLHQSEGNAELDKLLKDNQIENRSWIPTLTISPVSFSPSP